jgi:hypothetical protein
MNEKNIIKNAKIIDASITMKDHDCLTFYISLEGEGFGCCFGGYCIGHGYLGAEPSDICSENGFGLEAMMHIMNVVGVDRWEDLVGKYCRIKDADWGSSVNCIGNIMKDQWFNIEDFFKKKKEHIYNDR